MRLNNKLYDMIFKRKSFHLFRNIGKELLSQRDIDGIYEIYQSLVPLCPDIKTAIRIVPAYDLTSNRGREYSILIYSEKKDNYLANVGYLGEQLDLYLISKNIGTLWFGIGKPDEPSYNGLDYVIMIKIAKIDDEAKFRKDMFKAKRKPIEETWHGEQIEGVSNIARFAPSACNTQPWLVENDGNSLTVYRYKKQGIRGIMPMNLVTYYNRIDVGIYLCFLELCLDHNGVQYDLGLFTDEGTCAEKTKIAVYTIL